MGSFLEKCTSTDDNNNTDEQSIKNRQQRDERIEKERSEKERDRSENERIEKERLEVEKLEKERLQKEKLETQRLEQQKLEKEQLAAKQQKIEQERLEKERLERERQAAEQAKKDKEERDKLEAERLEKEKLEQEILERERIEKERLEQERIENERLEKERIEKAKLEQEKLQRERIENERLEKERLEAERLEREGIEKERLEKERIAAEKAQKEKEEREKREREAAEKARKEQEERERLEREAAEKARQEEERKQREVMEKERIEREKKLAAKLEAERIRKEKREKEERERLIRQKEQFEKKKYINLETFFIIEGYIRRFKTITPQDIINKILFFYTEPIVMNIKYLNKTKTIWYLACEPKWKTLEINITKTFELNPETNIKNLQFKHGMVTKSNWNKCRWDKTDIFTFDIFSKIEQTCVAIGRYYTFLEVEYDDLFSNFCEDNGFVDDDEVEEELSAGAEDSQIEFDEDFPFPNTIVNKDEDIKLQFMYDVINQCWQNPHIEWTKLSFGRNVKKVKVVKLPSVDEHLFEITKEDIEKVKSLYCKQCKIFWDLGMENDENMLVMLAIGIKYKFDYFRHLNDNYLCDRIGDNIDLNDTLALTEVEWWKGHTHNRQLRNIKMAKKTSKQFIELQMEPNKIAVSVVQIFTRKYCPKLSLISITQINDSIEIIIKYIHCMAQFINNLINNDRFIDKNVSPFQIDFCIATGKPQQENNMVQICDTDSDNDSDSDSDEKDNNSDYFDFIGNIKEKLEKNKLLYSFGECKSNSDQDIKIKEFNKIFETFIEKLGNSENKNEYPNRKRFITFVDRRNKNKNNLESTDPIWMYEPPPNCRNIPTDVVSEWYINASKTCLLPNMEYDINDNGNKMNTMFTNQNDLNPNITSTFHCKGSLLTISFVIKEYDVIKMYLYWNGQMTRLLPKYIKPIFLKIYNMNKYSNENVTSEQHNSSKEINQLIEEMEKVTGDKYYDNFCKTYC